MHIYGQYHVPRSKTELLTCLVRRLRTSRGQLSKMPKNQLLAIYHRQMQQAHMKRVES